MGQVVLTRSADEILGTAGTDDREFLIQSLRDIRDTIFVFAEDTSVFNDDAQLDHLDDVIEMLSGIRPQ